MNHPIVPPPSKFTPIKSGEHPRVRDGEQHVYKFSNGYGASVIRNPYSYGGSEGLYELAVLGRDGDIDMSTPVAKDVLGWLEPEHVAEFLDWIDRLPSVGDSNE